MLQIHELLCQFAEEGSTVVRLKGGDPYIFGRGGEEVQYLSQRGIQVYVVPGAWPCTWAAPCWASAPWQPLLGAQHRAPAAGSLCSAGPCSGMQHLRVMGVVLAAPCSQCQAVKRWSLQETPAGCLVPCCSGSETHEWVLPGRPPSSRHHCWPQHPHSAGTR